MSTVDICHDQSCHWRRKHHTWNPETCPAPRDTASHLVGDDGTRVYRESTTGAARELTAEDLDHLRARLDAYYYSFEPTGVQVIDDLLHAIAWAGKAAHHTEAWSDELWLTSYGPLRKDENWIDLIQSLANDGAAEIRKALLR